MLTYFKQLHSFRYFLNVDGHSVGEFSGKYDYGFNETIFDSTVEIEFMPHPTITQIKGLKIPDNFKPLIRTNISDNLQNQIKEIIDNYIESIKIDEVDTIIEERRKIFSVFFEVGGLKKEIKLIYDYFNGEKRKSVIIVPTNEVFSFPYKMDDDKIVSKMYDIINNHNN